MERRKEDEKEHFGEERVIFKTSVRLMRVSYLTAQSIRAEPGAQVGTVQAVTL